MAEKTFDIQVQEDHLPRISRVIKPFLAVAKLIWNAVDVDADRVNMTFHENGLGSLESIEVITKEKKKESPVWVVLDASEKYIAAKTLLIKELG